MACFAGPSYTEIQIDAQSFLPVKLTLPKSRTMIELVTAHGQMYPSLQQNTEKQVDDSSSKLVKKQVQALELEQESLVQQVSEQEQSLTSVKADIKDLTRKIEILNDIVRQFALTH